MALKIVYRTEGGGVSFLESPEFDKYRGTALRAAMERVANRDLPPGTPFALVDSERLPSGEIDSWKWGDDGPEKDRERSKQLKVQSIRRRRDQRLRDSDLLALRSLESLLPEPLRVYRQKLRDLPGDFLQSSEGKTAEEIDAGALELPEPPVV